MVLIAGILTLAFSLHYRRRTVWVLMAVAAAGPLPFHRGKGVGGTQSSPLDYAVAPDEESFSFPSGHTLNISVIAGMLACLTCCLPGAGGCGWCRYWWPSCGPPSSG